MIKKIEDWIFSVIIAGLLPIIIKFFVCLMIRHPFTYPDICSEIYFFNLMISADGLNEIYNLKEKDGIDKFLYNILKFFLAILSVMYGILILNNYKEIGLDFHPIYFISFLSTTINISISFFYKNIERRKINDKH